jgi:GWxTD domain-containing protein
MRRGLRGGWAALIPLLLQAGVALLGQAGDPEDWANSPEAYFLTKEERAEWYKLPSRDARADFKERYWLKRDPSPATGKNEFREMVASRIKTADSRFAIEKTPGSRTARGLVFIVLGSPSRAQDENTPRPVADSPRQIGVRVTPVAYFEGNETTFTWTYDRERTPRILEALERPSLVIKIVIEPSRRMDAIQEPGLFNEIRETIARKSIVNPDLVPPAEAAAASRPGLELPRHTLAASMRQVLEEAPAVARRGGAFVGSAVVFRDKGGAETLLWVFTPPPSRRPFLHALVRAEDGREVAVVSEPAAISPVFSTHSPGLVALRRLSLPPGFYSASVALSEEGGKVLAAAVIPVQVPGIEKEFAVSSLIVTRGPAPAGAGTEPTFTFGGASLPPRADAAFAPSESLWYFAQVANPSDASKVVLEARLRRGPEPVAELPAFPAKLQPMAPGRYQVGIELPLATLGPGDYVLYLTIRDGEGANRPAVLRRTDFQVSR